MICLLQVSHVHFKPMVGESNVTANRHHSTIPKGESVSASHKLPSSKQIASVENSSMGQPLASPKKRLDSTYVPSTNITPPTLGSRLQTPPTLKQEGNPRSRGITLYFSCFQAVKLLPRVRDYSLCLQKISRFRAYSD